jgi:hypothetical protein
MSPIIGIDIAGTNGDASMSRKTSAALIPLVRELTVIAVLATGRAARTGYRKMRQEYRVSLRWVLRAVRIRRAVVGSIRRCSW